MLSAIKVKSLDVMLNLETLLSGIKECELKPQRELQTLQYFHTKPSYQRNVNIGMKL